MEQLSHKNFKSAQHDKSIILICCELQSPANLGSICRLSEAFGVETLYINENNSEFLNLPRFVKTARHSHRNISIEPYHKVDSLIENLKNKAYLTVALELCDNSQSLSKIKFEQKVAIIVGHESLGIDDLALQKIDIVAHIEMYGDNSSINVSQATGIALYQCVNSK